MQSKTANTEYVIDGAILQCSCGSLLSKLTASNKNIFIQNKFPCTAIDRIPHANIAAFGICKTSQRPCTIAVQEWQEVKTNTLIMGYPALLYYSYLPCMQGGIIQIIHHGQVYS